MSWIIAGVGLLAAAVVVTITSGQVIWYGGMIVGVIWIVRGVLRLSRSHGAEPRE